MTKSIFLTSVCGFIAGVLAVPLFHQVAFSLLYHFGLIPVQAFSFAPTRPFGIPTVLSLSFWGGVWGILFALTIARHVQGIWYWLIGIIGSAVVLSLVAALVVSPLKGSSLMWSGNYKLLMVALFVNGCWGLGTAIFIFLLRKLNP